MFCGIRRLERDTQHGLDETRKFNNFNVLQAFDRRCPVPEANDTERFTMRQKMITIMRFDNSNRAQRIRERLEEQGFNPVLKVGGGGTLADLEGTDIVGNVELLVPLEEAAVAADTVDELEELEEETDDEEWDYSLA